MLKGDEWGLLYNLCKKLRVTNHTVFVQDALVHKTPIEYGNKQVEMDYATSNQLLVAKVKEANQVSGVEQKINANETGYKMFIHPVKIQSR
ncbi:hypothetical protein PsorP6_018564 [Peronosclerospora sorghi]|nr:hypothetical protein PsorP6_018564 [Peronosclerospora sorghi]